MRLTWFRPLLLVMIATAMPASAEEVRPSDQAVSAALAITGRPATANGVDSAFAQLREGGDEAAVNLATALGHAGGTAAADGLARLYAYRHVDIRPLVLRSACQVGLRSERLVARVRTGLATRSKETRLAACRAIGYLGYGRDVPPLLDLTGSDDAKVRHAAFAGLRRLSGAPLPQVAARWRHWWKVQQARADQELEPALRALDKAPAAEVPTALPPVVLRYAWIRLSVVEEMVKEWLQRGDAGRRILACRLVAALRLADLGTSVSGIRGLASGEAEKAAVAAALAALGIPDETPAAQTPERVPRRAGGLQVPASPRK